MNHPFLPIQKATVLKTIPISILCLQINFAHCAIERSEPFTDQEKTQLINGLKNALTQDSDLDDASLALLEQAIQYRKTHGKIILDTLVNYCITQDTFLGNAARNGNLALIQRLLKASVANNPNNQDTKQLTLQAGEDINHQDKYGETALHYTARKNYHAIAHLLITHGANVNIQDKNGETALIKATRYNYHDMADLLITHGANVNIQDKEGKTALYYAAAFDRNTIADLLITRGANINIKNNEGKTALHTAACCDSLDVARLLITHGANPYLKDNYGKNALLLASLEMQKVIHQALALTPRQARD